MESTTLVEALESARERGFLGPGAVGRQIEHAQDLATALGPPGGEFLDLGSGGGLPGLVLAQRWPEARGTLLDAQKRRCAFLSETVGRLGWGQRIDVACGRAESLARDPAFRGHFGLVVARSFGSPAVTAECAVGFLAPEGRLVVTEPPPLDQGMSTHEAAAPLVTRGDRWPASGLERLGLRLTGEIRHGETGAMVFELAGKASEQWPRRDGIPAKRPLW